MTKRWLSILKHICNIHEWEMEDGLMCKCEHSRLTNEQIECTNWIERDLSAFKALHSIVTNKLLLRDMKKMTLFKHTG